MDDAKILWGAVGVIALFVVAGLVIGFNFDPGAFNMAIGAALAEIPFVVVAIWATIVELF